MPRKRAEYVIRLINDLFFIAEEDEVDSEAVEKKVANGGDKKDEQHPPQAGRSNEGRWLDGLDDSVSENAQRSIENRIMLERIDFRTAWLMRIITGVGIALLTRFLLLDIGLI